MQVNQAMVIAFAAPQRNPTINTRATKMGSTATIANKFVDIMILFRF
jgi:hypothetical protein